MCGTRARLLRGAFISGPTIRYMPKVTRCLKFIVIDRDAETIRGKGCKSFPRGSFPDKKLRGEFFDFSASCMTYKSYIILTIYNIRFVNRTVFHAHQSLTVFKCKYVLLLAVKCLWSYSISKEKWHYR